MKKPMINYTQLLQGGGAPTAPAPVTTPNPRYFDTSGGGAAPTQTLPVDSGIGGGPAVPNQGGNPVADSTATGSPFGSSPNITPELATQFQKLLGENTYSFPAGGYIRSDANYKGGAPAGGDPAANKAMGDFYNQLGGLPTVANTSPALTKFNQATGASPTLGPSFNDQLAKLLSDPSTGEPAKRAGFGPKFEGPFNIPNY